MKKLVLLLIAGLLLSTYNDCQAQRLLKNIANKAKNKIERKVEEKAEEKVDEKIDEEIDKRLDEAFDDADSATVKSQEERDNERAMKIMQRMGMSSTPVNVEDSYSFSSNIKMEVESYKNGKLEDKSHINSFFNTSDDVFGYEFTDAESSQDKKGFFIMDKNNNATIILSDDNGEKKGIVTGVDMDQLSNYTQEEMENDSDSEPADFSRAHKTGRTKSILGHTCEEYIYKDEYDESTVWISKDKDLKMGGLFSSVYNNSSVLAGYPGGIIMEAESKDLNTNETSIMKVTEINDNIHKTIDLGSYEIMNLGSFKMPQEEKE